MAIVAEHYDLGEITGCEPLRAAHQRRHRKLVLTAETGKFLVKTYARDSYVLDALRFQHHLSDHLLEHGLPVARIQKTKLGTRIVENSNWAMELQEFVEGAPMQISVNSLLISGQMLGKFHFECRDFPRPKRDARMWRFSQVPRHSFDKLFERAKEEGDESVASRHCDRIAAFLQKATEALSFAKRNEFETGLIHGDWHGGNLIFLDEKLAAIVDLEFAGDGCYLEDLAYAMSNLCIRTTDNPRRLMARTDLLLNNYQRYRLLSFSEEIALYYAVGIKHIATVSYQMPRRDGKVAGLSAIEWMERLACQSEWLIERANRIQSGIR